MDGGDMITVELSSDFFNCPICLKPYQAPIFQCNSRHSLCSSCRRRMGKLCQKCEKVTVYKHNKTLESIVTQAKFRCVNSEFGCQTLSSCNDKAKHERKCLYLPIFCPKTNCNFRGSSDKLPGHLAVKHKHSIENFSYDKIFTVYLNDGRKMKPLVADDGTVFLLQNREESSGQAISVVCIRSPGVKEPNFLCDLKVKKNTNGAPECDLVLRCPVPITRLDKGMENSKYFLLVPAEFCSRPYRLINADVCIKIQEAGAMQPQRELSDSDDDDDDYPLIARFGV